MVQPFWKTTEQFLTKLNINLPHDSTILPLGTYPRETKPFIHTNICTQLFSAVLFITPNWKQPNVYHPVNRQAKRGTLFGNMQD